jgi:AcrR family transcriptional regulator
MCRHLSTLNAVAAQEVPKPYGRDEVIGAVIEAATRLFAERGPSAVSLREVATAADVNLGLIHRHIGSKTDLLAAVLRARPGMPGGAATAEEGLATMLARGYAPPAYTVILVRAALDGYDLANLGVEFPGLDRWTAFLREHLSPVDADIRIAFVVAMLLGWHAVGRVVLDVLGRGDVPVEEVVQSLAPSLSAFVRTPS